MFHHNNVIQFTYLKNGEPTNDYRVNFSDGVFLQAYQSLLDTLGINRANTGLHLSPSSYRSHLALFAYNDSPDSCNNVHLHFTPSASMGVISARVTFSEALSAPLKLMLFASHHKCVQIDKTLAVSIGNTV